MDRDRCPVGELPLGQAKRVPDNREEVERDTVQNEDRRERHAHGLATGPERRTQRSNRAAATDGSAARDERRGHAFDTERSPEDQSDAKGERDPERRRPQP